MVISVVSGKICWFHQQYKPQRNLIQPWTLIFFLANEQDAQRYYTLFIFISRQVVCWFNNTAANPPTLCLHLYLCMVWLCPPPQHLNDGFLVQNYKVIERSSKSPSSSRTLIATINVFACRPLHKWWKRSKPYEFTESPENFISHIGFQIFPGPPG